MKYCYWVWKELHLKDKKVLTWKIPLRGHLNGQKPRENWTELLVVFFWHKLLYGRCSVYRFNYASYIRYATLCPSVIYSLDDISIVHVVILVWCIQISSEALIASTISLLIGFRREPFQIRLRLR